MAKPTQEAIAEHLDLSSRQIRNLIADGVLHTDMSLDECRIAYIRYLRSLQTKNGVRRGDEGTDEKMRLARAQAEKAEFDNEVRRGEFMPVELHGEILLKVAGEMAGQMSGFPGRVAGKIASIKDPALVRAKLIDECNYVRDAVARILGNLAEKFAGDSEISQSGNDDSSVTAEDDAGHLGEQQPTLAEG